MDNAHVDERDLTERWSRDAKPGTIDFPVETTKVRQGSSTGCRANRVEQVLLVVAGTARAQVGAEEKRLTPGSTVLIPPRVPHEIHNVGDGSLRLLHAFAEQTLAG
jgi:mannose-6-phosphate isomerase-like protein (cupin superfamily)